MTGRIGRVAIACTFLAAAAAGALATERKVPSQYTTIQGAVDACAAGDVVTCASGTYTEAVVATKSRITIQGAAGAVWDGKTGSSAVTCLDLTGNANVVTGFAFKNGVDHCRLTGDDCKVKNCTSADAGAAFCVITGARARVESCRADRPRGRAVTCTGSAPVVDTCSVYDGYDEGICADGDDAVVKYCWVERCAKGGYRCKGNRHDDHDNDARSCGEFGFNIEGSASAFFANYAKDCGTTGGSGAGYLCVGDDNYFEYCDTLRCAPHGHWCKGNRNEHYDNWCDESDEDGFRHEGDDNRCEYDQARTCGRDGHRVEGNRNDSWYCDSYDNDDDGFECRSGSDNSYEHCRGKWNGGAGCENGGTSTDVTSCTFLYNTVDVGLSGSGATFGTFSLNTYLSGSIQTILKIGLGL